MRFRLPNIIFVLLGIKQKKRRKNLSPFFYEVPSRVELLYTVLQTVT